MGKVSYLFRRVIHMDFSGYKKAAQEVHRRSGRNTFAVLLDMAWCGIRYQAGYMDYLVFEFERLSAAQRATYVTRGVNNAMVKKLNDPALDGLFADKVQTLRRYAPFVKRKWLYLPDSTAGEFAEFVASCDRFVGKPVDGCCGRGVTFFRSADVKDPAALFETSREEGLLLFEEFVVQHPAMAAIYPDSVNTLRMVTVLWNGVPHLVFPSIRIGNGKQVDNLNAGGMASVIDPETGCISKPCADKEGNVYETHPMTGTRFAGYPIPYFQEAKELVLQLACVEPRVGYVGWDIAITENGPDLIEANNFPGHDIYQFRVHLEADGMGIKPRFDAIFREKPEEK